MTCADPYLREMSSASIGKQVFTPGSDVDDVAATLDITFDAWITCRGCAKERPLFGIGDDGLSGGTLAG